MNSKTAKAYRAVVRQMVKHGVLSGPYEEYGTNKHTGSRMLNPLCPKGVYRRMKRDGLEKVLTAPAASAA